MRGILFSVSVLLCALVSFDASANVRALVNINSEVISNLDLDNRIKFITVSSHVPSSESSEIKTQLREQAMQELVNEALFRQEAERLGIKISGAELDGAVSNYGLMIGLKDRVLKDYAKDHGVGYNAIVKQVESRLLWDKVILARVIPLITISTDEINDIKQQAKDSVILVTIQEMVMIPSVEQANTPDILKKLREEQDWRNIKDSYPGVIISGKKVTLNLDNMPSVLRDIIEATEEGDIISPLPTNSGHLVMKVSDRSKISRSFINGEATIKQIYVKGANEAEKELYLERLRALKKENINCANLESVADNSKLPAPSTLETKVRDLDPDMQKKLYNTKVDSVTDVINNDLGELQLIALCRMVPEPVENADRRIKQQIYESKVAQQSQELLNQVRASTLIKRDL